MCDKAAVIRNGEITAIEDINALMKKQMQKVRIVFSEKPRGLILPKGVQHEQWHNLKYTF
jgi:ABC-type multidrug transport system ATPase subunit